MSCKVVTDKATGLSQGYGYVHYETAEAANSAIEKLDGMLIDGKEVQVGEFLRRDTRPDAQAYTNVFLKNIPFEWDEEKLSSEFAKFGEIASVRISMGRRKKIVTKEMTATATAAEGDKEKNGKDEDKKEKKDDEDKKEETDSGEEKKVSASGNISFGLCLP